MSKARDFCSVASGKSDKPFLGKHLHKSNLASFIIVPGNTRVTCRNNASVNIHLAGFCTWKYLTNIFCLFVYLGFFVCFLKTPQLVRYQPECEFQMVFYDLGSCRDRITCIFMRSSH